MISTADDLNKFFSYLLGGKLLKEQQLQQMLTTVPTGTDELGDSGLGIFKMKLSNGVSLWWHGGTIPGFLTFVGGTLGGKHTLAVNLNNLKADRPNPFKNILLAEFSKWEKREAPGVGQAALLATIAVGGAYGAWYPGKKLKSRAEKNHGIILKKAIIKIQKYLIKGNMRIQISLFFLSL